MAVWNSNIRFVHKGNFDNTKKFLERKRRERLLDKLDSLGKRGVEALAANTPVDTGKTAASWYYQVEEDKNKQTLRVSWYNSNVVDHVNIAVIIQYGHATRGGGYVQGRDYINPALRPLFDEIATKAWEEVITK